MKMVSPSPYLTWLRLEDTFRKRIFVNSRDYYEWCDIVDNFAIFVKEATFDLGVRWDDRLKIGAEHQDLYLNFSKANIHGVARTNCLKVRNVRVQDSKFRKMRQRQDFFQFLFERHSLKSFSILGENKRFSTSSGDQAYQVGMGLPRINWRRGNESDGINS